MRVTIKDIAKIAGVSVATASMALNDKPGVNKDTKQRVADIASQMSYRPNHSARSLITKKSGCIGLIVTDIRNPFFSKLVDVFNKEVEKNGFMMMLGISSDKMSLEKKCVDLFISRNAEGIIIVPTVKESPDLEHLYMLKRMKTPFVFCTTAYTGIHTDLIMSDLMEGEYQLVKHLIESGRRRIAFVTCNQSLMVSKLRFDGFEKAHKEFGLSFSNEQIFETEPDYDHGYEVGLLLASREMDAAVTINDFLAYGLSKALKDSGLQIPKDIAVAGYDDILFSNLVEPALTTVRQPIEDICRKTMEVLIRKMQDDTIGVETYMLKPELIIRNSTV